MTAPAPAPARAVTTLHIACLCAAWCRTCEAYATVFDAATQALREQRPDLQAHWIDIEDEAELLGDLDIETFPTLLVLDGERVCFAGPLTPQPDTLQRVLRAALTPDAAAAANPAWAAFARRLRLRPAAA